MKLQLLLITFTLQIIFLKSSRFINPFSEDINQERFQEEEEEQTDEGNSDGKKTSLSTSTIKAYKTLIEKIFEYKKSGILPIYYPKAQREAAAQMVKERKENGALMKYITEPYRFCIFPFAKINAMTVCDNTLKKIDETRANDCKNSHCINCCNHLIPIYSFILKNSIVSNAILLNDDIGFNKIKARLNENIILKCRNTCNKEYQADEEIAVPPLERDKNLGENSTNPAKTCIDIKLNGNKHAKSGVYYLKPNSKKQVIKAYCDMEIDSGGWTLFFNYVHHSLEDYTLDANTMPADPYGSKSHVNLQDTGFDAKDVTELRFMCVTNHLKENKYRFIHFKTKNAEVIKAGLTGSQTHLKVNDKNKKGGFWDSPFINENEYWTVKGGTALGGRWECGDKLDIFTGANYESIHQVWFRGPSPSKEYLEARALEKLEKESGN